MESVAALRSARASPSKTRSARRPITAAAPGDLTPFQAPDRLVEGQVLLISLDPVAEHLGADWQGRRTEVYDRAGRVLTKKLGAGGAFMRVAETDYLVTQPALSGHPVEEKVVRILGDIICHFVGETLDENLRLFAVQHVGADHVLCSPLNARDIRARADAREHRDDHAGNWDLLVSEPWAPFVATDGRRVRPSCVLEPVFEITGGHRIGYRLRRKLIDMASNEPLSAAQQHGLTRADVLRIDRATLARGIERLGSTASDEAALSLIMPVSYFSLTHPQAGAQFSRMFARARDAVEAGVICEIYDIEGISQEALSAATALVRPWSLLVVGHIADESPRATTAMKAAGLQALSFTAPPSVDSDASFIGWLSPALRSARRVGRSVMVYGCQSRRRMALAGVLGATHASLTTA